MRKRPHSRYFANYLLIVPVGIEINLAARIRSSAVKLLIVPVGIEMFH